MNGKGAGSDYNEPQPSSKVRGVDGMDHLYSQTIGDSGRGNAGMIAADLDSSRYRAVQNNLSSPIRYSESQKSQSLPPQTYGATTPGGPIRGSPATPPTVTRLQGRVGFNSTRQQVAMPFSCEDGTWGLGAIHHPGFSGPGWFSSNGIVHTNNFSINDQDFMIHSRTGRYERRFHPYQAGLNFTDESRVYGSGVMVNRARATTDAIEQVAANSSVYSRYYGSCL